MPRPPTAEAIPLANGTVVQAAVDESLTGRATRRRLVGRIGGMIGEASPCVLQDFARALGADAQILSHSRRLVADWDCCQADGHPILNLGDWRSIVDAGRLHAVSGAFAVAWLSPEGSAHIARDAIGERTLYYALTDRGFVFASSIHGILATGTLKRTLRLPAVASYLTFAYLPGRETLVEEVYELLPGEVVQHRTDGISRTRFWSVPAEETNRANEDELRRELRSRLEIAVQNRLPRGEAVGAFLSGGLDSSLVVALAGKLHHAAIRTYSVSFGPGYANELPFSSLVAEHCRTRHRIVEISPAAVLRHLDDSIALLSDPIGDPLTVPNALLFREAAAEVGMVLNGEGGDPCFGGPKNLPMLLAELYGGHESACGNDSPSRARNYLRAHLKCFDDLPAMLVPEALEALSHAPLEDRVSLDLEDPRWPTLVTRLQALNVIYKGGHHILPKVDALSWPQGVIARSPLFDRSIVELSFAIPPQLKLRGSVEKYLLKQAVRDLLPPAIIDRPKSGMMVPVEAWFQGPLAAQARERILDGLTPYRLFRQDYLERLLRGRLGGLRPRHGVKTWLLITLEAWLRGVLRR